MKIYKIHVVISEPLADDDEAADKLYDSGCDDALFSISNNVYSLDFDREALTLGHAISSVIDNIHNAGIGVEILSLEGK